VKLEIDTRPPSGAKVAEHFHIGPIMFTVNHHDVPSLFAGEFHALLFRGFVKGRDYFDLMFFLSKRVPFDAQLLRNATLQTHPETSLDSTDEVLRCLKRRPREVDQRNIAGDLAPFLLEPHDLRFIASENMIWALDRNIAEGVFAQAPSPPPPLSLCGRQGASLLPQGLFL